MSFSAGSWSASSKKSLFNTESHNAVDHVEAPVEADSCESNSNDGAQSNMDLLSTPGNSSTHKPVSSDTSPIPEEDHSALKSLVCTAVRTYLTESLNIHDGFTIDAMIGVTTLTQGSMFYVTIKETKPAEACHSKKRQHKRKRKHSGGTMAECVEPPPEDAVHQDLPSKSEDPDDDPFSSQDSSQDVVVKQEVIEDEDDPNSPWCPNGQPSYLPTHFPQFPDPSYSYPNTGGYRSMTSDPGMNSDPGMTPETPSTSADFRNLSIPADLMNPEMSYLPRKDTPNKRYTLPLSKKVELIQTSHGVSHRRLAEIFKVSKTQVQSILKRKDEIMVAFQDETKHDRKAISDRACKMKDVNELTWMWYKHMMTLDVPISGAQIQRQAMHFARWLGKSEDEFKASNGWLHSFKQRHAIKTFSGASDKSSTTAANNSDENQTMGNKSDLDSVFQGMLPPFMPGYFDSSSTGFQGNSTEENPANDSQDMSNISNEQLEMQDNVVKNEPSDDCNLGTGHPENNSNNPVGGMFHSQPGIDRFSCVGDNNSFHQTQAT